MLAPQVCVPLNSEQVWDTHTPLKERKRACDQLPSWSLSKAVPDHPTRTRAAAEDAVPPGQSSQDIWEALEAAKPRKCLPSEGCPYSES